MQVLLSYSDDPRDVSEIRASEARYRALADSLRSKLDGQEHQARLDALKQREVGSRRRWLYDLDRLSLAPTCFWHLETYTVS